MLVSLTNLRLFAISRISPLWLGVVATTLLAVASYGAGAVRHRGGVLATIGWDFLTYGHARELLSDALWLGTFLLVAAWLLTGRQLALAPLRKTLWCWLIPLLFAAPLASRDVYSYLMQGAMVRDGFSPYTQGAAVDPGPYLLEVSQDWRNTTTPYGPLHLLIGKAITSISGDHVSLGMLLYKALSILGFAAIAWSVPRIAQQLGGNPAVALWLGVANPVMIIHLVGGMHNESIMVAMVSLGLLLVLRGSADSPQLGTIAAGIALIAGAVSLKATAFLVMPFVFWLLVGQYQPLRAKLLAAVAGGSAIMAETAAILAAITAVTGASWGWLAAISGNSKVINPLALPTLVADLSTPLLQIFNEQLTYNAVLSVTRTVGTGIMLLGLVRVWWLARSSRRAAISATMGAYLVAFTCSAVTLPWYYASIISLAGVARPPQWLLKIVTGLSIVLTVAFSGDGNHQLYNWPWMALSAAVAWWCVSNLRLPAGEF